MEIPQGYKFTKTHEWVKVDGDIVTIGISDFAQGELGDITYLELPAVGQSITKSDPLGVVESVKAATDVYSPVSGEVVEENESVIDAPELVNSSPYGDAWLVKIRLSDPSQLDELMDSGEYAKHVAESGGH
ncbi:MAG TPA: glycine cleavage system protein GcvH [Thermomicrobiales bacterium]|nr:glycine cleavage system protein GcvH [Chloroflexota bacterium]HBY45971.1 glycine cleavage system protein GcvH [Chloroflexota bacterium]HCG30686.1 glycine cleavage system protein GcvH [Chloroflexota bacterium]HQZ88782.1 glycine cleavage system protein GcvH [Thermomicrobiales bacterium]HRA30995.1 glycine cleavage system protein GcvH [Thermomicrobiales bacterium]